MNYQKQLPKIKVVLDIESFNQLVELLSRYEEYDGERVANKCTRLKEKIMKYSVPHEDDEQNVFIDIRFFPNEATDLIYLLLSNIKEIIANDNYYAILLKAKESIKENNN